MFNIYGVRLEWVSAINACDCNLLVIMIMTRNVMLEVAPNTSATTLAGRQFSAS